MTWTPRPGWCLVRPVTTEETIGSIVIPDMVRAGMTRTQYDVIASGGPAPTVDDETPTTIRDGDWVLAPQRVAFDVIEEGITLLSARNVWAVIAE